MPLDVEPAITMRPAAVMATAFAVWNRLPKPMMAVPPSANPGSSVPLGR